MESTPELRIFGWLIFAWGVALILISLRPAKDQVHSPTRRAAGVLSGMVFCLLASIALWAATAMAREAFGVAAVIAAAASWYMGRHARKIDRERRK